MEEYVVKSGVLQGDTAAPYLFVLVLDCIINDSLDPNLGLSVDGRKVCSVPVDSRWRGSLRAKKQSLCHTSIPFLAFADDMAILTKSTDDAQKQIRALQSLARIAGLELNFGKNKTEIELRHGACGKVLDIDGTELTVTSRYTYLGIQPLDPDQSFSVRLQKAWGAAKKLQRVWHSGVKLATKMLLFTTFVASSFFYGCEVWPS